MWQVEIEDYGDEWWFGGEGEGQAIIRDEKGEDIGVVGLHRSEAGHEQREANARLMASAPTLRTTCDEALRLLREVRDWMTDMTDRTWMGEKPWAEVNAFLERQEGQSATRADG